VTGGTAQRVTLPDGTDAWLVGGYDIVRAALADPRLSLDKRNANGYKGFSLPPALDANLLNMDPPDHTRVRRLVAQAFTARRSEALRPRVQQITDDLLDAIEPDGRADLIAAVAGPLPVTVICELLGVPAEARADFRAWTNALLAQEPAGAARAVQNLHGYFHKLVDAKRARPADDLLSALIAARDEDDRLTADELTSLAFLLLFAGYENVTNLIGIATVALLAHSDRALPSVDDLLREDPPAPYAIRRFPLEDVTLAGVRVRAGDTVLLSLREPGPDGAHNGFGHGIHYCLGAALARVEVETALATLIRRFPGLALDVPVAELRWRPSMRTRGLLELPVRW
jgi:cytochrome P450